jgi:hypothetical protein
MCVGKTKKRRCEKYSNVEKRINVAVNRIGKFPSFFYRVGYTEI